MNGLMSNYIFLGAVSVLISGCDNAESLTKSQSEVAGYCVTLLSSADDNQALRLARRISEHADELGFSQQGFKEGVTLAVIDMENSGWNDGNPTKPNDEQVSECRSVLTW